MTKAEIQQRIKDDIDWHIEETGISIAEAYDIVADNYILHYIASLMTEEDLKALLDEMGFSVDIEKLRKERDKRAKRKAYRKELQARKRAKREAEKSAKNLSKEAN